MDSPITYMAEHILSGISAAAQPRYPLSFQRMRNRNNFCFRVPSSPAANSCGIVGSNFNKVLLTPMKNPALRSIRVA
jgi:hypothetical protein